MSSMMRVSAQRRRATALVLAAALVGTVIGFWRAQRSQADPEGGLQLTSVATSQAAFDAKTGKQRFQATITGLPGSSGGVFPCRFSAIDPTGRIVGVRDVTVWVLVPENPFEVDVPVTRAATALTMSCQGREDLGTPYTYTFTNVSVGVAASSWYPATTALVTYDARWAGSGAPGAVECTLVIRDPAGSPIFSTTDLFRFPEGLEKGHQWPIDIGLDASTAASAEIGGCQPISTLP